MTFQFQVDFKTSFWVFFEFFDFSSPIFKFHLKLAFLFFSVISETKFASLDPNLMSSENVTSVEVAWLNHKKDSNLASETEDEELKALCAVDEAEADKVSITSSVPMDFGESLPPTLTTLMHKQFSLYRLFKEAEAELGVLITKKIQRDRRTSGYVIAYIEPNGLVDKDGRFKVGDELINVNGHSLRGLSMEAARNVLRQLSGHVDIIVARQPQETPASTNAGIHFEFSRQKLFWIRNPTWHRCHISKVTFEFSNFG